MKRFVLALSFAFALLAGPAKAAYVTLPEAQMDAIFSQTAFGNTPIDIRFGAQTQIVAPALLDLSTNAEVNQLFAQHVGPQDVVNFYFVDTISACGLTVDVNIIGCGETPGQDFVVESVFAADPVLGALLLAHELGHNLNLQHNPTNGFLMYAFLTGGMLFSGTEVNTILASPLVKIDPLSAQRYITINPVLVVAQEVTQQVPAPQTAALVMAALLLLGMARRRSARLPTPVMAR